MNLFLKIGTVALSVMAIGYFNTTTFAQNKKKEGTTESGIYYKFIKGKVASVIAAGDIVEMDYAIKIDDSLLASTAQQKAMPGSSMAFPVPVMDSANMFSGPIPLDGLYMMKEGDSAIFSIPTKAFFEKIKQPMQSWMKEESVLNWEVKMVRVLKEEELNKKYNKMRKAGDEFQTTDNGVDYRFNHLSDNQRITKLGDVMEFHIIQYIGDSLMTNTREQNGGKPIKQPLRYVDQKYDIMGGLPMMRVGDKVTFKTSMKDIALLSPGAPLPEWIKETDDVVYEVEAIGIQDKEAFEQEVKVAQEKSKAEVAAAQAAAAEDAKVAVAKNHQDILKYFNDNNIKNYKKTASGLYYVIHTPGTGAVPEEGQNITVNYTGKLLSGKIFDSNTDPAFNHVSPFSVAIGKGRVIKGWDEGLMLFNKGTKATLYIPSDLGYGSRGAGADIPANAPLIFDVEILDIQ